MERVTDGIYFIPGRDEIIPDSHVYVLGESHSHNLSMVDVGLIGRGEEKLEQIERSGMGLKNIERIILTHAHFDHIGCIKEILAGLADVEVWVHGVEAHGEQCEEPEERKKLRS